MAPKWEINEACNGETAIELCKTRQFGLIFMDNYVSKCMYTFFLVQVKAGAKRPTCTLGTSS